MDFEHGHKEIFSLTKYCVLNAVMVFTEWFKVV